MALFRITSDGDHLDRKSVADLSVVTDIAVDDEDSVFREKFRKFAEGMADIFDVFEEIEMIFFYIKDDCHRRVEG